MHELFRLTKGTSPLYVAKIEALIIPKKKKTVSSKTYGTENFSSAQTKRKN